MASPRIDELKKRYEENPRRFFAPLANEYRKSGDLEQAIAICQQHLGEQPGNMNGHVVYGQALFDAGRYDDARTTFETALTLDPENLIALRHLGDIARLGGDSGVARDWYQRVLDADPRNEEILAFIQELPAATAVAEAPPEEPEAAPAESPLASVAAEMEASAPAAPEPAVASEAKTLEFVPPKLASSAPTPVIPMRAVAPPAKKPDSGSLLDVSIDLGAAREGVFDTSAFEVPAAGAAAPVAAPARTPEPAADLDSFGEVKLETPAPAAAVDEAALAPVAEAASPAPPAPPALGWEMGTVDLDVAPAPVDATPPPLEPPPAASVSTEREVLDIDNAFAVEMPADAAPPPPPPPAASSTDFLFGDSPALSDAPAESAPAAEGGATPEAFVTETMAELYLQQGFRDQALDVYRQLSAMNPADDGLKARVRSLESGGRSSVEFNRPMEVPVDEPMPTVGGFETIGSTLSAAPPPPAEPTPVAPIDSIDSLGFDEPLSAPANVPVEMAAEPVASAPAASGQNARSFFAALSVRRPVPRTPEPASATPVVPMPEPAPATADSDSDSGSDYSHGTIDMLFGTGAIAPAEEAIARALSEAASGAEVATAPIKGRPTLPAASELSLDAVFRSEQPLRKSDPTVRMSSKLRFDQFFAPAPGSDPAPKPASPEPSESAPASPPDEAAFQSWLQNLKKQ